MSQQSPVAVVSYLPTREDYEAFLLAVNRRKTGNKTKTAVRLSGALAAGLGGALFLFSNAGLVQRVAWAALLLLGLFLLSYYGVLRPYSVKKLARSRFEVTRRMLVSQTVELFDREFTVRTDRYHARFPYELLYRVVENKTLYLLYTGEDEVRFIPKRVMDSKQCEAFTQTLKERIGSHYDG